MADNDDYNTFDGQESMFDFSQRIASRYNPMFKTVEHNGTENPKTAKSMARPTTVATKKKVTFRIGENNEPEEIDSESMSSFGSDLSPETNKSSYEDKDRAKVKYNRNKKRLSLFYQPALMTKNFNHQIPLFLSEKNMNQLSHLFKNMQFFNKYQKSIQEAKRFKKIKYMNQQKTKTLDKMGELDSKDDMKGFLAKDPGEIFSNALANFWFKDSDKFLQMKKSLYVKKQVMYDLTEPTVYERMQQDVEKRQENRKK